MKRICAIAILAISFSILLGLTGCREDYIYPDAVSIGDAFVQNKDNIETITNYLIVLDYDDVWIDEPDGLFFANFEWHSIEDEQICTVLKQLWEAGISDIKKSEDRNSVSFEMWWSDQDVCCGVAYSIDGINDPTVQFLTTLEPLAEQSWYYYVADYNLWRIEQTNNTQ